LREGCFKNSAVLVGCIVRKMIPARYFKSYRENLQIGNAVPPVLGEVVAREILKSLRSAQSRTLPQSREQDLLAAMV
jgi:hypothetical protein